jgi:hypothetical protein
MRISGAMGGYGKAAMKKDKQGPVERYLKVYYATLKNKKVNFGARILWSFFDGFKLKGCWMTDLQIAETFAVGARTVSSWIKELKAVEAIIMRASGSRYRTIWSNRQYALRLKSTPQNQHSTPQKTTFNSAGICNPTPQNQQAIINKLENNNNPALPSPSPETASASAESKEELERLKANVFGSKVKVSSSPAQKEASRKHNLELLGFKG